MAATLMAAMFIQLGGCATPKHGWQTQQATPKQVITDQTPDRVRVTKVDGTRLEIWEPHIAGDSLAGRTLPEDAVWIVGTPRPEMVPVSLPLEEIRYVEVPAVTKGQVAVGILIAALSVAAAVVVVGAVVEPFGS
jgi:hypothetical protein